MIEVEILKKIKRTEYTIDFMQLNAFGRGVLAPEHRCFLNLDGAEYLEIEFRSLSERGPGLRSKNESLG